MPLPLDLIIPHHLKVQESDSRPQPQPSVVLVGVTHTRWQRPEDWFRLRDGVRRGNLKHGKSVTGTDGGGYGKRRGTQFPVVFLTATTPSRDRIPSSLLLEHRDSHGGQGPRLRISSMWVQPQRHIPWCEAYVASSSSRRIETHAIPPGSAGHTALERVFLLSCDCIPQPT